MGMHGDKSTQDGTALIVLSTSDSAGNELRVPPFLILVLACFFNCVVNMVCNMVMAHGRIPWKSVWTSDPATLQGSTAFAPSSPIMKPSIAIIPPSMHPVEMGEMSPTSRDGFNPLILSSFSATKHDTAAAAAAAAQARKGPILGVDEVFMKAQMIAFHMNVQFTMLCVLKSLIMVVVVFYHFQVRGGWDRFVVCSAAFLSSGQMTPLVQYIAKYVLPLDVAFFKNEMVDEIGGIVKSPQPGGNNNNNTGANSSHAQSLSHDHQSSQGAIDLSSLTNNVEKKKLPSGVFMVEVLIQLGTFDLHDFETAFFSGSTFVVLAIVVLPPFITFCSIGLVAYCWLFGPALLLFIHARRSYYIELIKRKHAAMSGTAKSPKRIFCEEVARAFMLRFATATMIMWMLQTSFVLAVAVWSSGSGQYFHIILRELRQRLDWDTYWNLLETDNFQRLCFFTQLIC